jgi:hypothetical protein
MRWQGRTLQMRLPLVLPLQMRLQQMRLQQMRLLQMRQQPQHRQNERPQNRLLQTHGLQKTHGLLQNGLPHGLPQQQRQKRQLLHQES